MKNAMKLTTSILTHDVYLYVLVRSDLHSLTGTADKKRTGIVCAQVTHAANLCVFDIHHSDPYSGKTCPSLLDQMLDAWQGDTGFGACVVLEVVSGYMMTKLIDQLKEAGHHAAIVRDPSYPLRDGLYTHHIPVETCAYAFGTKHLLAPFLSHLSLLD